VGDLFFFTGDVEPERGLGLAAPCRVHAGHREQIGNVLPIVDLAEAASLSRSTSMLTMNLTPAPGIDQRPRFGRTLRLIQHLPALALQAGTAMPPRFAQLPRACPGPTRRGGAAASGWRWPRLAERVWHPSAGPSGGCAEARPCCGRGLPARSRQCERGQPPGRSGPSRPAQRALAAKAPLRHVAREAVAKPSRIREKAPLADCRQRLALQGRWRERVLLAAAEARCAPARLALFVRSWLALPRKVANCAVVLHCYAPIAALAIRLAGRPWLFLP